jgi:hypothetical protein
MNNDVYTLLQLVNPGVYVLPFPLACLKQDQPSHSSHKDAPLAPRPWSTATDAKVKAVALSPLLAYVTPAPRSRLTKSAAMLLSQISSSPVVAHL